MYDEFGNYIPEHDVPPGYVDRAIHYIWRKIIGFFILACFAFIVLFNTPAYLLTIIFDYKPLTDFIMEDIPLLRTWIISFTFWTIFFYTKLRGRANVFGTVLIFLTVMFCFAVPLYPIVMIMEGNWNATITDFLGGIGQSAFIWILLCIFWTVVVIFTYNLTVKDEVQFYYEQEQQQHRTTN